VVSVAHRPLNPRGKDPLNRRLGGLCLGLYIYSLQLGEFIIHLCPYLSFGCVKELKFSLKVATSGQIATTNEGCLHFILVTALLFKWSAMLYLQAHATDNSRMFQKLST
jgi:hypothetical protein